MTNILEQMASGEISVMESLENTDPVTENDMASVLAAAMEETCSEEEKDELIEQVNNGLLTLSPVEERTIVKLDKKAKKQQAYKVALYKAAAEMNIKEFRQLKTLWAAENELELRIEKKCHNRAKQIMRETAKQHKDSPIKQFKKGSDSITRSQARTKKALSGTVKMNNGTQNQARQVAKRYGNMK